ncbi:MAG: metallophosphoesterase family protein, partial [Bacteroidota bacterium]
MSFIPINKSLGKLSGPLLLFGGAYSNLQALLALRAEAERRGIPPQNVICCGDTPGYCADPEACLELVEAWGIHAIAGNVETNLVLGRDDCGCGFGDGSRCDMFAKLWYNYAANNITEKNKAYMAGLPDVLRFTYAGKSVAVLHGSPRNQSEFVWRSTPAELKAQFAGNAGYGPDNLRGAEVVIGGHCGVPFGHVLNSSGEALGVQRPWARRASEGRETDDDHTLIHGGSSTRRTSRSSNVATPRPTREASLWLNAGVIGMPANDGTPRTWFMTLDDANGFDFQFHPLHYDHRAAKARMLDDRRLPVSYAATLTTGIWDNTEIMPPAEEAREGIPLDPLELKNEVFGHTVKQSNSQTGGARADALARYQSAPRQASG